MEGDAAASDFQDWEILPISDFDAVNPPNSVEKSRSFEVIVADSEGMIRLDYFSIDNDNRYSKPAVVDASEEEGSVESDNSSWIDPGSETRFPRRNSGELWPDSWSDRSDDLKIEVGLVDNLNTDVGLEGIGESVGEYGNFESSECNSGDIRGKNEMGFEENLQRHVDFEGYGETHGKDDDLGPKLWLDSGGDGGLGFCDSRKVNVGSEVQSELEGGNGSKEDNSSVVVAAVEEERLGGCSVGEGEGRRKVVWWKIPFEVLRYCLFRASPVWSFSMAAAVMGFVILGRRLYRMKHKTRTLQVKVTMDAKKASQVMSRAARLNEAFSVVRRVPIVRPLLPATGLNPWPVMSLR